MREDYMGSRGEGKKQGGGWLRRKSQGEAWERFISPLPFSSSARMERGVQSALGSIPLSLTALPLLVALTPPLQHSI
jgi:hypothetical protein